jgi:hypothetical protein
LRDGYADIQDALVGTVVESLDFRELWAIPRVSWGNPG